MIIIEKDSLLFQDDDLTNNNSLGKMRLSTSMGRRARAVQRLQRGLPGRTSRERRKKEEDPARTSSSGGDEAPKATFPVGGTLAPLECLFLDPMGSSQPGARVFV
jgi:hypothetical protein